MPNRLAILFLGATVVLTASSACTAANEIGSPTARTGAKHPSTPASTDYSAAGPDAAPYLEGAVDPSTIRDGLPHSTRFRNPLPGGVLAGGGEFGAPRDGGLVHGGLDITLPADSRATTVLAPCDGHVSGRGVDDRTGRYVEIDCGSGWTVRVGFLGRASVEPGANISGKLAIGIVDSTLRFVHVEILEGGVRVDPTTLLGFGPSPTTTTTPPQATSVTSPSPTSTTPTSVPTATIVGTATAAATSTATTIPISTATPSATPRPPTSTRMPTPRPISQ